MTLKIRKPRGKISRDKEVKQFTEKQRALMAAEAAYEKKAVDITILNVAKLSDIADYFIICTALNARHAGAIAHAIQDEFFKNHIYVRHVEGIQEGGWVLLDCYDILVHIFVEETREFYRLEDLWGDATKVAFKPMT